LQAQNARELESSLSILRAKIKDDERKYMQSAEQNAALSEQVAKLNEQLQVLNDFQRDEEQLARVRVGQAGRETETLQAKVDGLTRSRQELQARVTELERAAADAVEARRNEAQLRADLAALRAKHDQDAAQHQREMHDLRETSRQLQQRLTTAEIAAATAAQAKTTPFATPVKASPTRGGATQQEAEDEITALKEKIEDLEAELDDSQKEVDSLSSVSIP
jgi:chromosome segregation ATPase